MESKILNLTDNNYNCEPSISKDDKHYQTLDDIARINLKNECSLLLFPQSLEETELEQDSNIISFLPTKIPNSNEFKVQTNNIMGFIGKDNLDIRIHSRFDYTNDDINNNNDYFLYYMLSKVAKLNVFNLDTQNDDRDILPDLYMMLFPQALKDAIVQGLYKEYRTFNYNDDRIKGSIDVNRFIQKDIPFQGKVSYHTREYSHDNHLLQLIRHTIEYMRTHSLGHQLLNNDFDTRSAILQIINATTSYNQRERLHIIQRNSRIVSHPYYTKYRPLQKICLNILTHKGLKYGSKDDKVHGILFDGAWLWEEYLNTLLKPEGFEHPNNKKKEKGFELFETKPSHTIYPDFYKVGIVVADAKYKKYAKGEDGYKREPTREDLYQIITYIHRLKVHKGVLICPCTNDEEFVSLYKIKDTNDTIHVLGLNIPQSSNEMGYRDFCSKMELNEEIFLNKIKGLYQ